MEHKQEKDLRVHQIQHSLFINKNSENYGDFPGGPGVKTLPYNSGDMDPIPGQRAKIPNASWPKKQNIKEKKHCNNFNNDLKRKWSTSKKKKKNLRKKKELWEPERVRDSVRWRHQLMSSCVIPLLCPVVGGVHCRKKKWKSITVESYV